MRADKSISKDLIVVNSVNSPLFKCVEAATDFIEKLNDQQFYNIAVIVGNSGDLERYAASFPKEVLLIESRNDIELVKNIFKYYAILSKEDLDELAPYIIAVDQAKKSFNIKDSSKVLLIDFDENNRRVLTELSKRFFCGVTIRFGRSNASVSENAVITVVKKIRSDFIRKNDKFIYIPREHSGNNKSDNYQVPSSAVSTLSANAVTKGRYTASASPIVSMSLYSSQPYIQDLIRPTHNNVNFYTGKKEDPESRKIFSRHIEKYSIILGNIVRGSIAHQRLINLTDKIESEIFVGKYIISLSRLVQSLLPEIIEEKSLLSYHLEANPNGYSEGAILKFYYIMGEITMIINYLSKIYTHSLAEKFIKDLNITLKDFERFSTLPSAEMLAEEINSENRVLQPEMQQTSSENSIALRKEEKGKEKEDLGTDTEDEIDEKEDIAVVTYAAGSIKRKYADEIVNKKAYIAEKSFKKPKSYVTEETKPSGSASERELSRRSKQSNNFSRT
ncbi:hypothetical protein H1Q59_07180 [Holosporaceae bacterium 'Namur']|nr:hypothetical protein [Holosporaceae bacterium 'Namur']